MIELTLDRVNELLDEAVAEKGADYAYPDRGECLYVHVHDDGTSSPGCIVGNVLHRAGVPLEDLRVHEYTAAPFLPWVLHSPASTLLFQVQKLQDDGVTWADAVATARAEMVRP